MRIREEITEEIELGSGVLQECCLSLLTFIGIYLKEIIKECFEREVYA